MINFFNASVYQEGETEDQDSETEKRLTDRNKPSTFSIKKILDLASIFKNEELTLDIIQALLTASKAGQGIENLLEDHSMAQHILSLSE